MIARCPCAITITWVPFRFFEMVFFMNGIIEPFFISPKKISNCGFFLQYIHIWSDILLHMLERCSMLRVFFYWKKWWNTYVNEHICISNIEKSITYRWLCYIHTLLNQSQWVKISKKVNFFWQKPHSSVNLADFQNENQFDFNSKNLGFWSISLVNISISINLLFLKMIAERRLCALLQTFKSLVQLNILHRSQPHVWRKQFSSWGSTIFSKVQIISLSSSPI